MTPEEIGTVVSVIGLLTQIGGNLLLVGLFVALGRGHPRREPYFREWTRAWAWLLAGLGGVLAQYALPSVNAHPAALWCANLLYQSGKMLFVVHLLAGSLNYARGVDPVAFRRRAVPLVLLYAVVTTSLPGMLLNGVVLLQAPLVAATFLFAAWLLLRIPAARASFGSRATGSVFGALSAVWVGYFVAYASLGVPPLLDAGGPFAFLLLYNSYLDLLLQMLLGYAMVVLLLEDAKRDVDDARAQLSLAHDRLKRASLYDALTGALNRRAYEDGVGLEGGVERGTVLMLDMDNLKVVNDRQGHAAGDDLLCRLVDTLRGCIAADDRLYRWGGDEFLVLSPAAAPDAMVARIRAAVEAANAAHTAESPLFLQVSLGAAAFDGRAQIAAAMEQADQAMYQDKALNRIPISRVALPAG